MSNERWRWAVGGGLVASAAIYARWMRPWFHRWGATPEESSRSHTGDDLVPDPGYQATLAVTVNAPPGDIWPWLMQLGNGRGGLYSYDWLDRLFGILDSDSADHLLPQVRELRPGDTVPIGHDPRSFFPVLGVEHERALVLSGDIPPGGAWSWTFILEPLGPTRTRLISRSRVRVPERRPLWMTTLWIEPAAFLMTRKMLLNLKARAERSRRSMVGSVKEGGTRRRVAKTGAKVIAGFAKPGFEAVREAFIENFERRKELGAACCVYHRGEKVVDLWGGIRDASTGEPWEEDTMVLVYSTTKGMAGLAMALAHSRGLYDYDECVSTYWPEFAQQGKERITVRQLMSHQAGLFALDERIDSRTVADPDRLAVVLARQKPAWGPGTRQAYHAITLGFYESELLRRVDPRHRTLGRFFQEELADPLRLDFYIRLPEEIPDARLARLRRFNVAGTLFTTPLSFFLSAMNPRSRLRRALMGSELPEETEHVYARNFEVPAGGGVGTARALAHAYGVFATGGKELDLREDTLRQLMAPAIPPSRGFRDACLKVEVQFSLGFSKPGPKDPFGHPSSFGHPGTGGSFAFADPHAQIGYAYVPNRMGTYLSDPREAALRTAMYRSIGEPDAYHMRARPRRAALTDLLRGGKAESPAGV